ncbi:MAG: glutathione S-transferase family protein [Alcaligenaceae bacterium]|nr:glutathione S-transferase family protein [Alcaligenaceae bacterium]
MKLYYMPGACPLATHIVLEWAGQPYETQAVPRDKLKEPEFLALNPVGSVPVLTDGDLVLTQSAAILEYVAEKHPEADLMPQDIKARAETRRWLGFVNADLHKSFGLVFGKAAYTSDTACQEQLVAGGKAQAMRLFGIIDKQLEGKQWVTGTRSVVDAYLYTVTRWALAVKMDLSGFSNLMAFFNRMNADAGVKAAVAAEGLE